MDSLKRNINIFLDCFDVIEPILLKVINGSFQQGIFPICLKEYVIIPIPKEQNNNNCDNFRPINMLPIIEKSWRKWLMNNYVNTCRMITAVFLWAQQSTF